MSELNMDIVRALARQEIYDENFRKAVEAEKTRLLNTKWWHHFVPIITITWRKTK